MKKSSKQFVISSEKQNALGFKVRTSGIDLSEYDNNPIMLWMHRRPTGASKDEVLPLGNMVDLEFKDGKLYGTPLFDETDPFAKTIYDKVENGTIRMASAGLKPLLWGSDDMDPWLEASRLVEVSIVDIGSNSEALSVTLYDNDDNIITLSDKGFKSFFSSQNSNPNMKLIQLSAPELCIKLKLAEGATPEQAMSAIDSLVTLAATQADKITTLTSDKQAADQKAAELQTKLDEQVKLANTEKIEKLADSAIADRKYLPAQRDTIIQLATSDYEGTKALIDAMPGTPTVHSQLTGTSGTEDKAKKRVAELVALSRRELFISGGLEELKKLDPEAYAEKNKEPLK